MVAYGSYLTDGYINKLEDSCIYITLEELVLWSILMSIPTREIRKLSIGGKMPTTRSQAQREKQRRDVGSGQLDIIPSVESETAPSTTQSPSSSSIRGRSGLVYDIRKLSPMSTTRASVGLPSEFIADERSRTFRAGGETYHAIQLNNRVAIRIYDPTTRSHRVECTCDDFKRTKSNCVHIYVSLVVISIRD